MMAFLHKAILIILVLLVWLPQGAFASEPKQLVILNWGMYLDPELIDKFEKSHDAKINQILYVSDEERSTKLLETDAKGYDLILTSGITLDDYVERGWLAPLDRSKAPNLKYLSDRWEGAFTNTRDYGVPYFWGTLGIVYRADLVKEPITSWKQFFSPAEDLRGRIMLMDDAREVVSMGLKSLGYSANTEDSVAYKKVKDLLIKQRPYVKSYSYVSIKEDSALVTGEVVAAMAYNGDALMVAEHNEDIVFVLPEEGGNIWVDYFVLAAKAKNPDLAYEFLNFINDPDNAAKQAEYVYYSTPNIAAEKLLPKEFLEDQTIYPPAESLKNSEFYKHLSPKTVRLRNNVSALILR